MTQSQALDILKMGKNVFLTGSAGTGKTYVINQYIEWLKQHDVSVAVTASTGIAATHIGGQTIHSWSGIGIKDSLSEWDIDAICQKEHVVKRWQSTAVLVIDEISMLSGELFNSLDRLARAARGDDRPFGGMQIVAVGDFFQLPPVGRPGAQPPYAFQSDAWRTSGIQTCYLKQSFRQDDDQLLDILNSIRSGDIDESLYTLLGEQDEITVDDVRATRLYTHNIDVDAINSQELEQLSEDLHVFDMITKGTQKQVESIMKGILAPQRLGLKEGALVMFVRNNYEEGYVNGTLGTVTAIRDGLPVVMTHAGQEIHVSHESWSMENDNGKVVAEIKQIPLRLAWAITIHKSQGMTLDAAEIDLSKSFVPGQGYVALSRVRSLSGLKLYGINENALMMDPTVREKDKMFQEESERLVRRLDITPPEKLVILHHDFIVNSGGELDIEKVIEERKESQHSTYDKTLALVRQHIGIEDMAKTRGCTVGTIITHLEKLVEDSTISLDDLAYLDPRIAFGKEPLDQMAHILEEDSSVSLSSLKEMFQGQYDYEDLKLMRLFARKNK